MAAGRALGQSVPEYCGATIIPYRRTLLPSSVTNCVTSSRVAPEEAARAAARSINAWPPAAVLVSTTRTILSLGICSAAERAESYIMLIFDGTVRQSTSFAPFDAS